MFALLFLFVAFSHAEIKQGSCGTTCTYTIDTTTGLMKINGTGPMNDYYAPVLIPWTNDVELVKKVEIEKGITVIGQRAFDSMTLLESVSIPSTITKISMYVFNMCYSLKEITIQASVVTIEQNAFLLCLSLKKITYEGEKSPECSITSFAECKIDQIIIPPTYKNDNFCGFPVTIPVESSSSSNENNESSSTTNKDNDSSSNKNNDSSSNKNNDSSSTNKDNDSSSSTNKNNEPSKKDNGSGVLSILLICIFVLLM